MAAQPATETAPDPAEDGLPVPQRYWAILTLMIGLGLSCLDTAIVNVALPAIAGPSVAAAIIAVAPWPWLFAVNVPIGLVTLALSLRLLPHTPPSRHGFDLWSAGLCAVMFGLLITAINGVGHGQAALPVAAEFAAALATGYVLVRRQLTQTMPLLPIDLFRRPSFALSVPTSV